jgi:hypothetical protein
VKHSNSRASLERHTLGAGITWKREEEGTGNTRARCSRRRRHNKQAQERNRANNTHRGRQWCKRWSGQQPLGREQRSASPCPAAVWQEAIPCLLAHPAPAAITAGYISSPAENPPHTLKQKHVSIPSPHQSAEAIPLQHLAALAERHAGFFLVAWLLPHQGRFSPWPFAPHPTGLFLPGRDERLPADATFRTGCYSWT